MKFTLNNSLCISYLIFNLKDTFLFALFKMSFTMKIKSHAYQFKIGQVAYS